jgi:tetratricopeptide (TPR) repeat protein
MRRSLLHFLLLVAFLLGGALSVGAEEKSAEFYNNRGNEYREKKDYDKAIADFNKALELNFRPPESVYYNRGATYGLKGHDDQAMADFNKALELNPKLPPAYEMRAMLYFKKKEYDKAWNDVHKAQSFGYRVYPWFLKRLRKDSGRDK